jgi:hypothetical protein
MLQQRKYQRTIMPYSCQHITVVYVGKACGFDHTSEEPQALAFRRPLLRRKSLTVCQKGKNLS